MVRGQEKKKVEGNRARKGCIKGKGSPENPLCPYRGARTWGKWVTEIREPVHGTRLCLGTFNTSVNAALAYDDAARPNNGADAKLNLPELHAQPTAHTTNAAPSSSVSTDHQAMQTATTPTDRIIRGAMQTATIPTDQIKGAMQTATAPTDQIKGAMQMATAPTDQIKRAMQTATAPTDQIRGAMQTATSPTDQIKGAMQTATTPTDQIKGVDGKNRNEVVEDDAGAGKVELELHAQPTAHTTNAAPSSSVSTDHQVMQTATTSTDQIKGAMQTAITPTDQIKGVDGKNRNEVVEDDAGAGKVELEPFWEEIMMSGPIVGGSSGLRYSVEFDMFGSNLFEDDSMAQLWL